jgi:hypothetical protein
MILLTTDSAARAYINTISQVAGRCYDSRQNFVHSIFVESADDISNIKAAKYEDDSNIACLRPSFGHSFTFKAHMDAWPNARKIYESSELLERVNGCSALINLLALNLRNEHLRMTSEKYFSLSQSGIYIPRPTWEIFYEYLPGPNATHNSAKLEHARQEINKADFEFDGFDYTDFSLDAFGNYVCSDLNKLKPKN